MTLWKHYTNSKSLPSTTHGTKNVYTYEVFTILGVDTASFWACIYSISMASWNIHRRWDGRGFEGKPSNMKVGLHLRWSVLLFRGTHIAASVWFEVTPVGGVNHSKQK